MGPSLRRPFLETFLGAPSDEGEWVLHFHCYLLRDSRDHVTLVDTGVGPVGSPASSWAPVPGRLREELAALGVRPADVDTVIFTHMHSDHYSGTVVDGEPVFANARHVIQRAEPNPLAEQLRDLLHLVEGDAEVAPGVWVRHTPGHTPGHQIVETGGFTMAGDVLHHPVQLADPTIRYVYDDDSDLAAKTRLDLVARLRAERRLLATAHFPEPFVQL
ncbi:MBL fold metallo-hydrolase [Thermoactinospora rubra]|uniref:MBL fold metallo-hydrolase n=1 Tax=Thermoactinospora rubra TaxID=1088767 RepID=UPI000A106855|nr:MBL fold metallo-hydrolase [Thermoactinospora rubra]